MHGFNLPATKTAHTNLYTYNNFDLKGIKRTFNFVLLMMKYII